MQNKRKIFKIILISSISVFLLAAAGVFILLTQIDPNKYKPLIIEAVYDSTGRKLRLDGNISWQIWPNIGLQIKQISLSNPENFGNNNFIEIQNVSLAVNLLPLLKRRVVINDLSIKGLKLNLITKNDNNNWTFSSQNKPDNKTSAIQLDLHSFSLLNSDITYNSTHTKKEIKNLNFSLHTSSNGGIHFDSKTNRLNLEGVNFNLNENLKGTLQLDLKSEPNLSYKGSLSALTPFSLNKLLTSLAMQPSKAILDNVSIKSSFIGNNKSLALSNLVLTVGKSILQGSVKINDLSTMSSENNISINQINLSDWVSTNGYEILMRGILLNGTFNNANLGIAKMGAKQHLTITDVLLYGINVQNHITSAGKILTVKQFTNPVQLLERLLALLLPSSYTKDLKQKTDLGKLDTNIVLQNGILTTPGFSLSGPTLRVTNSGLVNFNRDSINYHLYAKIVSVPAGSLLGNLTYPYIIQGNLNNPTTSVDKISLQKQIIDYYTKMGLAPGVMNTIKRGADSVKQGTVHLWNKVFH